jgi:hypothetical protein
MFVPMKFYQHSQWNIASLCNTKLANRGQVIKGKENKLDKAKNDAIIRIVD